MSITEKSLYGRRDYVINNFFNLTELKSIITDIWLYLLPMFFLSWNLSGENISWRGFILVICPQFFLDCIANTTAAIGSIFLKTFWLGISFLHLVDAYRERKKLLQQELQALEKEAEARCVVLVSCNCSILVLLLSYFSARIYRHWVFLHPFILFIWTCFNYHRNSRIKTAPDQTPTSRKGWNYVSIVCTNVRFLSMLNLLLLVCLILSGV